MAIKRTIRLRCPKDGTWFPTQVSLGNVMRWSPDFHDADFSDKAMAKLHGVWPDAMVRLSPYRAEPTHKNPEGIYFKADIRIGSDHRAVEITGVSPYAANLARDSGLDGWDNDESWLYYPTARAYLAGEAPGEDASFWLCDTCGQTLYRDPEGRRSHNSACLKGRELVCRDCDVDGLVCDGQARDLIERCRRLADFVGPECRARLESRIEFLSRGVSFGRACQTRMHPDGDWSFFWSDKVRMDSGKREQGMVGGLIMHGPHAKLNHDGTYAFTLWDYSANAERPASEAEIARIEWSIHT